MIDWTIASTATLKFARTAESDVFYTPLEERFERITRLARRSLHVPVAAVTLICAEKQWFKSVAGWNVRELPRDQSLCSITVRAGGLTVIENTELEPRTDGHPLVTAGPRFRFYAGVPLHDEHASIIGTFCAFDLKPRTFSAADRQCMQDLAALSQRELATDQLRAARDALTTRLGVARREAMTDPLTRLWNRRGASVLLKAAFDECDRENVELAVALLDFDNFKHINDSYGHKVGDEVLRRVASRLVAGIRADDVTCRIGGDEFLVIMTDTNLEIAGRIAQRAHRRVTETAIPSRRGSIPMSISIGFSVRKPNEPISVDALLERAERGLTRSKSAGRDRVHAID